MSNIILLASVHMVDEKKAQVRVKAGALVSGWLNIASLRAGEDRHYWLPEVGEQVVVASPDGDMNQGVVIGSIFSERYPPNDNATTKHSSHYKDGAVFRYDREAHHYSINLPADGKVTITVGSSSLVMDGNGITLKAKRINLN